MPVTETSLRMAMKLSIGAMLDGVMPESEMLSYLPMLPVETIRAEELAGAVEAVMERAVKFPSQPDAVDCCGTGGDGKESLNVSTAAAILVAACGVNVAKHGNRAVSSKSGSADVLTALGVKVDAPPLILSRCLQAAGIAFFFAPQFHPGFARVAEVRRAIGKRTIFNLLGPLCNPARVSRQLIGVFDKRLIRTYVEAARLLGRKSVLVVHGEDGLDECSVSAETFAADFTRSYQFTPEDAGLTRHPPEALRGGDAKANAEAMHALFSGQLGAYRDAALLNAAATLQMVGKVASLRDGVAMAANAITSQRALAVLEQLKSITHE
jgi:anthranilate phosphoribosyltransferase